MKVILIEDINNLGQAGEIVEVKRGYANNYLLRQNLAVRANKVNLNQLKTQQRAFEAKRAKSLADAQEKADQIRDKEFTIKVRTGEAGRLFGAVTNINVAEALREAGYDVERRDISLLDQIKEIGTYKANIKLHPEVSVDFIIHVEDEDPRKQQMLVAAKEAAEAKDQAEAAEAKANAEAKAVEAEIAATVAAAEAAEAEESEVVIEAIEEV